MLYVRGAHKDPFFRLLRFDGVALTWPRQVGKSRLARKIASEWDDGTRYLDLEQFADRRLLDDPFDYFSRNADKFILLKHAIIHGECRLEISRRLYFGNTILFCSNLRSNPDFSRL